jgi:1,4-dihydroxy-2-naphthoate octaprenyltransferase
MAIRIPTLPAAVVPVFVGSAIAYKLGSFQLLVFLAALIASICIQIGTNLANDYFDAKKGADTEERLGPTRVTHTGLIAPDTVRNAMLLSFLLAAICGVYLIVVGGWPILVIGLFSIASGIMYTGGPFPLGYNGLGDLFTFVFFGLIAVIGTTFVHTGSFSNLALFASLPVGMLVTAIIVVNNVRDVHTDRKANKRTLAVLLGERFARSEYAVLVIGAYVVLLIGWLMQLASTWIFLPFLTIPLAVPLVKAMWTQSGRVLNPILGGTGRLHMIFGVLLTIALAL